MSISLEYVVVDQENETFDFAKNKPALGPIQSMFYLRSLSKKSVNDHELIVRIRDAARLIYDNFDLKSSVSPRKRNLLGRMLLVIRKTCLQLIFKSITSIASNEELQCNEGSPLIPRHKGFRS